MTLVKKPFVGGFLLERDGNLGHQRSADMGTLSQPTQPDADTNISPPPPQRDISMVSHSPLTLIGSSIEGFMVVRTQLGTSGKNITWIRPTDKGVSWPLLLKTLRDSYCRLPAGSNHSWSLKVTLGPSDLQMTSVRVWGKFKLISKWKFRYFEV